MDGNGSRGWCFSGRRTTVAERMNKEAGSGGGVVAVAEMPRPPRANLLDLLTGKSSRHSTPFSLPHRHQRGLRQHRLLSYAAFWITADIYYTEIVEFSNLSRSSLSTSTQFLSPSLQWSPSFFDYKKSGKVSPPLVELKKSEEDVVPDLVDYKKSKGDVAPPPVDYKN